MFGRHSHRSHVHYLRTLKGVVGMLRNPEGTDSVFDIEDGLRHIDAARYAMEHVRSFPEVAALFEERYLAPPVDMEQLAKMPPGSLGAEFHRHIESHGFDPDYFRKIDVQDDVDYFMMRMRQTHDIWHVVTGIGTDRIGELAVKAFELAQTRRPLAAVICSGGVVRYVIRDPDQMPELLSALSAAYRQGVAAKPFLAQKWELGWDRPLADWRRELNVNLEAHIAGSVKAPSAEAARKVVWTPDPDLSAGL